MAQNDTLPEGTDQILDGAAVTDEDIEMAIDAEEFGEPGAPKDEGTSAPAGGAASGGWNAEGLRSAFGGHAQGLMDQAGDRARDYVSQGLDRATSALDDVVRMVDDAAGTIDGKIGAQYGDYARQASGAISGFADTLRMKDADTLFEDARDAVRNSPAIAIGAAAALGFVVARIIKAGSNAAQQTADDRAA